MVKKKSPTKSKAKATPARTAVKKKTTATAKKSASTAKKTATTTRKTATTAKKTSSTPKKATSTARKSSTKTTTKKPRTRVSVRFDVGFGNELYLRGSGPNLSWDRGQKLQCKDSNEWVFETDENFDAFEFKCLINDKVFEEGTNRLVSRGGNVQYTPAFSPTW